MVMWCAVYVSCDVDALSGCWLESESHVSTLKRHGFRGDSRWIGVDRVRDTDTLVGMTESGNMYVLQQPYRMCGMEELPVRQKW